MQTFNDHFIISYFCTQKKQQYPDQKSNYTIYKVKFSFAEKISGQYSAQHKSDNKEYKHMYQAKFIEQLP